MKIKNILYAIENETPVYYVNTDTLEIFKGIIVGINNCISDVEVKIQIRYNVSTSEKNSDIIYTNSNVVFAYLDEALDYQEDQRQYKTSQYELEIKTIKDLLMFPLNHQLNGDICNECALEAYKQKAKKLCDIEL